ncbi:MAG: glycoside hydrolase family 31 protein [Acidimicrobiia bacterium]|nr:glycoside hydrolase family 31 protein [Acidimicrobiia bacterium]
MAARRDRCGRFRLVVLGVALASLLAGLLTPSSAVADAALVVDGDGIRAEIDTDPLRLRILDGSGNVLLEEKGTGTPRWAGLSWSRGLFLSGLLDTFETPVYLDLDLFTFRPTRVLEVADVPGGLRLVADSTEPGRTAIVTLSSAGPRRMRVRLELSGNSTRDHRLRAAFDARPGEHFVGANKIGTRVDQRGRSYMLGADRTYGGPELPAVPLPDYHAVPFFLSDHGYGVAVWTDGAATRFDLAAGGSDAVSFAVRAAAVPLEFDVYAGDPASVVEDYTADVGRPQVLPEWAYGVWKSRNRYANQAELEDDIDSARGVGFPVDVVRIDSPWETTYNTWEPNPEQWEDFPGMLAGLSATGAHPVTWITGWMNVDSTDGDRAEGPQSELWASGPAAPYAEMAARDLLVERPSGSPYLFDWWMGRGSFVDFSKAEAREFWRDLAVPTIALGLDGLVLDGEEGYYLSDSARFSDGRTGAGAAWGLIRQYRETMLDALAAAGRAETVVMGRSATHGAQAQGITWPGDQWSTSYGMREVVTNGITAGAAGFSNWAHDVGGYFGRPPTLLDILRRLAANPDVDLEDLVTGYPPTKPTLVRWAQLGAFSPVFHLHSIATVEPWDAEVYDAETLEVVRHYARLHEQLVPYVRAMARLAAESGIPVVRGLFFEEPERDLAWTVSDAYFFGDAFWVAPVLAAAATSRHVPLPAGRWIDYWTGEVVAGGSEITAPAPLDRIPVYVRPGAIVPTYPSDVTTLTDGAADPRAVGPGGRLDVRVWPWVDETSSSIRLADGAVLSAAPGRFEWTGSPAPSLLVRMPLAAAPAEVRTDLGPLSAAVSREAVESSRTGWYWDAGTQELWAAIPTGATSLEAG